MDGASDAELSRLSLDENIGVALQCSWELGFSGSHWPLRSKRVVTMEKMRETVVPHFRRLLPSAPDWWIRTLVASSDVLNLAGCATCTQQLSMFLLPDSLIVKRDGLTLAIGNSFLGPFMNLSGVELESVEKQALSQCSFIKYGSGGFIALFGDPRTGIPLFRFDAEGTIVWMTYVWGSWRAREQRDHYLQLAIQDGLLLAFGGSGEVVYLDAFDPESGKTVGQFATDHWGFYRE